MCIVDSGIAFNSPFPAVLRPERDVQLILSFDFSQKDDGDDEPPFAVSSISFDPARFETA
jgi:phospholipase A2